jgi:hypothetical protein
MLLLGLLGCVCSLSFLRGRWGGSPWAIGVAVVHMGKLLGCVLLSAVLAWLAGTAVQLLLGCIQLISKLR